MSCEKPNQSQNDFGFVLARYKRKMIKLKKYRDKN